MSLADFIRSNIELIMAEWEAFARSLRPGQYLTSVALRNDAERMLQFIAGDLETAQSPEQQNAKAKGAGPQLPGGEESAAHDHGVARLSDGFSVVELISEYRALRASVTRLWLAAAAEDPSSVQQLTRFNEAIDQLLAESIVRFEKKQTDDHDLTIAILAHDLRNPLHAIRMTAAAIQQHPACVPPLSDAVKRIAESGARMDRLIADLLAFARTRLGAVAVDATTFDLADLVRGVAAEFRAGDPGREITVSSTGDTRGTWDFARLQQLASNLIGNAIQHGSPRTPVAIALAGAEEWVDLWVRNAGPVIPPNERNVIFKPLHRAEGSTTASGGLGLGLYIVREIATAHRGTVEVESSDANGTVFHVRLGRHLPVLRTSH